MAKTVLWVEVCLVGPLDRVHGMLDHDNSIVWVFLNGATTQVLHL